MKWCLEMKQTDYQVETYPVISRNPCGILNAQDISLFTSAIGGIQNAINQCLLIANQSPYVILPDNATASLLLYPFFFSILNSQCFSRVGMHVPAFLFRVYVFQAEFERYSMSHHIQYPVPTTLDFALHVCNNREASIRGLNRCLDVKDAFCSLLQKGHILGSPSPLLLIGDHEGSVHTMGKSNRHLSMDGASAFSFASPSFLSPARRTLSEESSLFPSLLTPDDFPDFHFSLHSSFPRESSGLFTFHDLPSSHDSLDDPRGNPDWLPTRRSRLLQNSFDELQEPRRRASSFALPGFANTPSPLLSHGEVALLPPLPDAADGFSLRPPAVSPDGFSLHPAASPEGSSLLGGRSGLNPHSAEFVPHALHLGSPDSGAANASIANSMNPAMTTAMTTAMSRTKTGKPGKAASKRDLLVSISMQSDDQEETMLTHRIEENHILTLKLRGLPYSVRNPLPPHA